MKKRLNKIQAGKRAPWWALVLLVGSLFIGCTKESIAPPVKPGTGDATVILAVNTPRPTLPTAFSRSQTESESRISGVKVLVFETGSENIFSYMVSGQEVSSSGSQQTQFKVELAPSENPLKIILIANAGDVFSSLTLSAGMTEGAIREKLNALFSANGLQNDLPMYGEALLPEGVDAAQTYNISATALRAVARVDVVKDLASDAPEFILEEVYAFRANDRIQLIPDVLEGGSTPKVTAPSVPEASGKLDDPVMVTVSGGTESITQIYLPESLQATTNTEKIYDATTIVIGGRFGGTGNPVTYYRADFNSGIAGHPFGQILRNHRYIFNIKRVGAEGWPTPDEAANHLSSSISVDVQTWEDFSSELYYGEDRFAVSAREISLRYVKNRARSLDVESTLSYRIQWLDAAGNPTGSATSDPNTTISNGNFDATIVPGGTDNTTRLVFRTLNHNHMGSVVKDKLRITAGKWSVDITVKQDNSVMYSDHFYNVLTVEGTGDLGTNLAENAASSKALRAILDKQFAPDGVIRLGGFSFNLVQDTPWTTETSALENLAVMKRLIGGQSIIYLPYDARLSSEVGTLLLDWVNGNSHRVLIIGTDTENTNRHLVNKPQIIQDGTWQFTNVATITTNYARGAEGEDTDDFFHGPFGDVSADAAIKKADNTAGYSTDHSKNVTPLLTSDKAGNGNYMFFGVNRGSRIVYNGDTDLFRTTQMSNNSGNVTSDLDKLMANTWAWIVEQVIYGEE